VLFRSHHVYNTDEEEGLVWGKFIHKLNESFKKKNGRELIMQLDFSATPQFPGQKKVYFQHIIYDYTLEEAIVDKIVKKPIIGVIEGAPEPISKDFVEKNKLQIDTGLKELENFKIEYEKLKKPVLCIMCDNVRNADKVGRYVERIGKFKGKVLVIHTDKKGDITKSDLPKLRIAAKEIDKNEYEIIISVMMLKEGWDVKNVSCIVPLRAYTSQILVEQTLGRGLRRMFPDNSILQEQLVVIEHPKFRQLWESEIKNSNLEIDVKSIKNAYQPSNKISVDNNKIKYDFEIPIVLGGLTRKVPNISELKIDKLPLKQFKFSQIKVPKIMYKKKELLTQKIIKEEELSFDYTDKHFEYLSYMATAILAKIGFTSQFSALIPLLRKYIEDYLFDQKVEIEDPNTVKKLNDPHVRYRIRDIFVDAINKLSKLEEEYLIKRFYKLSETQTIHTSENVYKAQKSVFDYLPYSSRSKYEKDFMIYLDGQKDVIAYTKVLPRFPLRIPYYDADGFIRHYIPDFIVKTKKGFFVVETKGVGFEEMSSAKLKKQAAVIWCEKISKLLGEEWKYVKIVEDVFRQYISLEFNELMKESS
jgi:type III restriction enzyme